MAVIPYRLSNAEIADTLQQLGDLLEVQGANVYRVRAYREAGRRIRSLDRRVADILAEEGRKGLELLPAVGKSIAAAVDELLHRGRLRQLERLLGEVSPEDLFTTVPGIGERLAHRLHDELHLETLEELELAAHDGRLERLAGFGPRRAQLVRDAVGAMLDRSARRRARLIRRHEVAPDAPAAPRVARLLEIDDRYRRLAHAGRLRTIAPRRFNPGRKAWLPIMHEEAGGWSFTAMYSNTARAHQLGRTQDWVIIYHERDGHETQCTIVTETHGPLSGRRVVRGRERECAGHYARENSA